RSGLPARVMDEQRCSTLGATHMYRILLCAMALSMASAAKAQQTRGELEQLRQRVDELEKRTATKPATNAFNPDISIILQGTAARSSQNPDDYPLTGFD